ncbi:MAG: alpha/beta hydrolase [Planctomycetota bacterium]
MKTLLAAMILTLGAAPAWPQTLPSVDLVYATVGATNLNLRLYRPLVCPGPWPVVIFFHGGGWSSGSHESLSDTLIEALNRGLAVASVEYRLTSEASKFHPESVTFPAQIHDAKAAVRCLRARADELGLDSARFASAGVSAGGHLAVLLAVTGGTKELEGRLGPHLGVSSAVQACVDFFGPVDLLNLSRDAAAIAHPAVDHDAPGAPASRLLGWGEPGQGLGDMRALEFDSVAR